MRILLVNLTVVLTVNLATTLLTGPEAQAFPDLIRHNYVNCTTCHVSPSGGGSLTAYGRSMSKEVLSTWGGERETAPLHGLLPDESLPPWLNIGGDVRGIQVHRESPMKQVEKWMMMQTTLELSAKVEKFLGFLSLGKTDPQENSTATNISTQYYLMWNPQDELSLRLGRFMPNFGINVPYHTLPTRQRLGFSPGQERDAFAMNWAGEEWNLDFSTSRTPVGPAKESARETLITMQVNRNFLGSYRFGLSYLKGFSRDLDREGLGAHVLAGFSEKIAYLSEFTLQKLLPYGGKASTGLYHFSQFIYEPVRGVQLYFLEDYERPDLENSAELTNSFGPGVRLYPRPHFEIDAVFLKRRTASLADRYDDFAWLLFHYYF